MALVFLCKCTLNKLKDFPIIELVNKSHIPLKDDFKNFSSSGLVGTYISLVLQTQPSFQLTPSANSEFPDDAQLLCC